MSLICTILGHKWNLCKCTRCGAIREEKHVWDRCHGRCLVCGTTCAVEHKWDGCKCAKCGATRNEGHDWRGTKCVRCGAKRPPVVVERDSLADYRTGDCLAFGRWKGERLVWRVLDVQADSMLMITQACMEPRPFNRTSPATWDVASLRAELNGEWFYANPEVFTEAERAAILPQTHDSPGIYYQNQRTWEEMYAQRGGDVEDRVFLLSVNEAVRYFNATREDWMKDGMGYNAFRFPVSEDLAAEYPWWLRNATRRGAAAVVVTAYGMINYNGFSVTEGTIPRVRPAVWVSRKAQ